MIRGRHQHVSVDWSPEAILAIDLWRATLVALRLNPDSFARPILTMGTRQADYMLEYDACLTGIGFIISTMTPDGGKGDTVCAAMIPLVEFDLQGESTYQNSCEFLAVVTGLAVLAERGVTHSAVHIVGDNMSSLAWCEYQCFHSTLSRAASMSFMAITTICDIRIAGATHIRGVRNIVPDRLSRAFEPGMDPATVYAELGLAPEVRLAYEASPRLRALVAACNPAKSMTNPVHSFYERWGVISDLVESLGRVSGI